jgi:hypothetical protein
VQPVEHEQIANTPTVWRVLVALPTSMKTH